MPGDVLREPEVAPDEYMREKIAAIESSFAANADVSAFMKKAEPLLQECMQLVRNRKRHSTLAWQRGKGPGFVVSAMKVLRGEAERMPKQIAGHTLEALLRSMRAAFLLEGSEALRLFLQSDGDRLEEIILRCETIDDIHHLVNDPTLFTAFQSAEK
jgi:hypothetical protein